jgi:ribosomal protein S18 acetylase RimI-like enzyme
MNPSAVPEARRARPFTAMRVARPTVDITRARAFYEHAVRLPVLGSFVDHDGFDGVIFGVPDDRAQLEIVRSPHHDIPAPSAEDALVLYHRGAAAADLVTRLRQAGAPELTDSPTVNPYWPHHGARVFGDPDGYRLIVALPDGDGRMPAPDDAVLRSVPAGPERDRYLPLFHLADDSADQVLGYYQTGTLFASDDGAGAPIGIVLAVDRSDGSVELKAVAVDEALHDRGIGTRLLAATLDALRARGVNQVVVGTSSSGVGQLAFYQKAGFRLDRIERGYFSPDRGYPEGTLENGIPLRDMVWMDQLLAAGETAP